MRKLGARYRLYSRLYSRSYDALECVAEHLDSQGVWARKDWDDLGPSWHVQCAFLDGLGENNLLDQCCNFIYEGVRGALVTKPEKSLDMLCDSG